jgi:hypothetical protein
MTYRLYTITDKGNEGQGASLKGGKRVEQRY